ncbi:MAG TPA: CBS domain-containing protein [Candidatus Binatia bacterium]|nr:CBS domain-containing protein [Candidatus Binatia bacterium]
MPLTENSVTASELRSEQIEKYWAADLARRTYLYRRQRKAILENCRRIAVVGASADPNSPIFTAIEKLLGMGLEIIPVFPGRESLLGLRCFAKLSEVPGTLDIVQVYPNDIDLAELAREAVAKSVNTFWMEPGMTAPREVEEILLNGKVHLVEYENLETEYLKHMPLNAATTASRKDRKATKVRERMSKNPATVMPDGGLKDAIWKMEHGHFRHLPVVDEHNKLIGMLTDRDVRQIKPSLAFTSKEDAAVQLWSISVQQAAVFDPISVKPDTSLKEAAELMLRWHVGGLPVVDDRDKLIGIVTYTDILREFIGHDDNH